MTEDPYTGRARREFFYVSEHGAVRKVTGYLCEGAAGYWWCPEIGYSAAEGTHLFRDRDDAYDKALVVARDRARAALAMLDQVEHERWA